jgi:phage tail-like protein
MGRTITNDPQQRFRFKVEIGTVEFGCKSVQGLEKELDVTEYREGGYTTTHKLPGIAKTGTLQIEKGAFANVDMYNMVKDSLESSDFRDTITIIEQNRNGKAIRQWQATEAWASKFTAPEYDAESSEVATEQIEIQYEDLLGKKL